MTENPRNFLLPCIHFDRFLYKLIKQSVTWSLVGVFKNSCFGDLGLHTTVLLKSDDAHAINASNA
jgi:hypothetical protein